MSAAPVPELAPVRAELLDRARADAAALLAAADAEAAAVVAAARGEAAELLADARAQGERDAAGVVAEARSRARRQARTTVLRAQREAYEQLCRRSREASRALRVEPAYQDLLAGLRQRARAELGPDATVVEHPDGGVLAEAPGRRVRHTLDALADRAVAALGAEVEKLWAP